MRLYVVVYVLLVAVVIEVSCDCGIATSSVNTPNTNGNGTKHDYFPWHVNIWDRSIMENGIPLCAGTLISPDVVITAAQCFHYSLFGRGSMTNDIRKLTVTPSGAYRHLPNLSGLHIQKRQVRILYEASEWRKSESHDGGDIAWIVLERPFNLTSSVKPICVDWGNQQDSNEIESTESGMAIYISPSAARENIEFTTHSRAKCASRISEWFYMTADKFCGFATPSKPLMALYFDIGEGFYSWHNGRWYLRGVVNMVKVPAEGSSKKSALLLTNVGRFANEIYRSGVIKREVTGCGIARLPVNPMIVGGFKPELGRFPWHVAVYQQNSTGFYQQICGGSLISLNVVVSAAHCFYDDITGRKQNTSSFAVAAGKYYRPYNWPEIFAQKSAVQTIHLPNRYQGAAGLYANDIAWLMLEHSFNLSALVVPICVDLDNSREEEDLQNGRIGKIVGWGKTEAGIPSNELREVNVPFIPYEECVPTFSADFRPFVTSDKFCAGYLNRTSVCDGDSGGGLAFERDGRWYLRGIVSVGPLSINREMCDAYSYTAFTNVGCFADELRSFTNITTSDFVLE